MTTSRRDSGFSQKGFIITRPEQTHIQKESEVDARCVNSAESSLFGIYRATHQEHLNRVRKYVDGQGG